jgi:hypothetical protein
MPASVERAGRPDADAAKRLASDAGFTHRDLDGLIDHAPHARDHRVGPFMRARGLGLQTVLLRPVRGHGADDDVRAAEVDADDELRLWHGGKR